MADVPNAPGGKDDGLSDYARAMQKSTPWTSAVARLTTAPLLGGAIGYGIDRFRGHQVPWGLIIGLVVGITAGLYGFLSATLKMSKPKKP